MKKIMLCLLVLCLMLTLTACGGDKGKEVDLNALTTELTGSGAFTMDISQFAMNALAAPTYGFDAAKTKSCSYFYDNGSNEELLVVEATDGAAAEEIEQCCQQRVELQKAALENYNPDAIPRLDSAVLVRSGNYVVFVVSSDSAAVKAIVDSHLQ